MPAEGNGTRPSIFERVRRALRGIDHAGAPALPLGEALHPITLAAVGVLAVNDRVLKLRLGPGRRAGAPADHIATLAAAIRHLGDGCRGRIPRVLRPRLALASFAKPVRPW